MHFSIISINEFYGKRSRLIADKIGHWIYRQDIGELIHIDEVQDKVLIGSINQHYMSQDI